MVNAGTEVHFRKNAGSGHGINGVIDSGELESDPLQQFCLANGGPHVWIPLSFVQKVFRLQKVNGFFRLVRLPGPHTLFSDGYRLIITYLSSATVPVTSLISANPVAAPVSFNVPLLHGHEDVEYFFRRVELIFWLHVPVMMNVFVGYILFCMALHSLSSSICSGLLDKLRRGMQTWEHHAVKKTFFTRFARPHTSLMNIVDAFVNFVKKVTVWLQVFRNFWTSPVVFPNLVKLVEQPSFL